MSEFSPEFGGEFQRPTVVSGSVGIGGAAVVSGSATLKPVKAPLQLLKDDVQAWAFVNLSAAKRKKLLAVLARH